MSYTHSLLLSLLLFAGIAKSTAQTASTTQAFHSKLFGWTIDVPAGFENVSPAESQRLKSKGIDAIEDTYGGKVEDQTTTLFTFRRGNFNYMESNHQPFTPEHGTYGQQRNEVSEVVYETFRAQLPDAKIDTASTIEIISKLEFHVFHVTLELPNGIVMSIHMFNRLFGNREFSLNIFYVEPAEGKLMMDAWKKSKFE